MRLRKLIRPILLSAVALISSRCVYIGYLGSLAPDAFEFAKRQDPAMMAKHYPEGGPYPELIYIWGVIIGGPFAVISILALIVWIFGIRLPGPARPTLKKSTFNTLSPDECDRR